MEEVVRMLGNYLRVCEKHYAKSVQSRLGLACSGNVERIGIVLSKPNHTKSLKNQWRASCGIAIYETGGEGRILLPPLSATVDETYTSVIIACVGAGYKRIATSVPVSMVSLIGRVSTQNGITGISSDPLLDRKLPMKEWYW